MRDTLGLTYDVSFELTLFDRLRVSWFSVSVTSYPDKVRSRLEFGSPPACRCWRWVVGCAHAALLQGSAAPR